MGKKSENTCRLFSNSGLDMGKLKEFEDDKSNLQQEIVPAGDLTIIKEQNSTVV